MKGSPREPRHEPRKIAGVPVDFCECTFHAVNGASVGSVPTCKRHAGAP